jgi:hypothetical protein
MSILTPDKASKFLADVPEQKQFMLYMGTNIKSLHELGDAIAIMADRTFLHHVAEGRNDFSNWIRDVVGDHDLAERISKMKTKQDMAHEINKRVHFLARKPSEHVMCKHDYMQCGVNDFAVGTIVGFVIGIIIAAVM